MNNGKLVAFDSTENLSKPQNEQNVLTLEIKASEKDIKAAINNVSGIENIQILQKDDSDVLVATVYYNSQNDIREQLSMALGQNSLPVLSMNVETKTLEDIFLNLTDDEQNPKNESETNND